MAHSDSASLCSFPSRRQYSRQRLPAVSSALPPLPGREGTQGVRLVAERAPGELEEDILKRRASYIQVLQSVVRSFAHFEQRRHRLRNLGRIERDAIFLVRH